MICEELFKHQNPEWKSKMSISMLEIYNERVQDLLIKVSKRPKGGLRIRENVKIGVFVEGLSKYDVENFEEILEIIEKGNENKTLGSTLMNATSSRAHTII